MPFRCCVAGCKGNYPTGPKVQVFRFPRDQNLLDKWKTAIPRDNLLVKSSTRGEEVIEAAKEIVVPENQQEDPEPQIAQLPKPAAVRPWDIGKPGVTETSVMSQEEWVKKRRMDRTEEFAPPALYQLKTSPTSSFEPSTSKQTYESSVSKNTLFFTSKRTMQGKWKTKQTCESSEEPHISNSIENVGDVTFKDTRQGVEIPPPPTFSYYGPTLSSYRNVIGGNQSTKEDVENSIVAGLRYLRQQAEEREKQQEKGLLDIM